MTIIRNSGPLLGDRARDKITGFEGIVVAQCQFLNGCQRVMLQPKADADGKMCEGVYFDIEHVEVIEAGVFESFLSPANRPSKGGYADPPLR